MNYNILKTIFDFLPQSKRLDYLLNIFEPDDFRYAVKHWCGNSIINAPASRCEPFPSHLQTPAFAPACGRGRIPGGRFANPRR